MESEAEREKRGKAVYMREKEPYRVPQKRKPFFRCFKQFLKLFVRKPEIVSLGGKPEERAIVVSNHSAASGLLTLELYYPNFFIPWGTFEMCQNYRGRFRYLNTVYYRQKKKYPAPVSFVFAAVAAAVTRGVYKGMQLLPSYPDARLLGTIRKSVRILDEGKSVLIFPEDSSDGYKELLTEYYAGFVFLAKTYRRLRGVDLPVYNCYFHKKKRLLIIDRPVYLKELFDRGMNEHEIAAFFKDRVNALAREYLGK